MFFWSSASPYHSQEFCVPSPYFLSSRALLAFVLFLIGPFVSFAVAQVVPDFPMPPASSSTEKETKNRKGKEAEDPSVPLATTLQSCTDDLTAIAAKRSALIEKINANAKAHKGKLDPIQACPVLKSTAAYSRQMKAYTIKNKNWCSYPDSQVDAFAQLVSKDAQLATQACQAADQMRKAQQQGGGISGGAVAPPAMRLPAGPL